MWCTHVELWATAVPMVSLGFCAQHTLVVSSVGLQVHVWWWQFFITFFLFFKVSRERGPHWVVSGNKLSCWRKYWYHVRWALQQGERKGREGQSTLSIFSPSFMMPSSHPPFESVTGTYIQKRALYYSSEKEEKYNNFWKRSLFVGKHRHTHFKKHLIPRVCVCNNL